MAGFPSRFLRYLVLLWSAAALTVAGTGLFTKLPVFAVQIAIALQMLVLLAVLALAPALREHLLSLNLRALTAFHVWRVLPGSLFLYDYYVLHQLPWSFAVPGGYGDILVALTAIPASWLAKGSGSSRMLLLAWQSLAFFDLAGVVRAGLVNGLHNPESMRPLTHLPLSLLPAMLVPLTFMMHVIAVAQIGQGLRQASVRAVAANK